MKRPLERRTESRMLVIGHRGASGHTAENTVGAMRRATVLGVDGVEFDVRAHSEELIVLHDDTLDRTTNGKGRYDACTFAALRELRTANGEPIPLLTEILAALEQNLLINAELKDYGAAGALVAALRTYFDNDQSALERLVLSSFDFAATEVLARSRGAMKLGVLYRDESFESALTRADSLQAWSMHLPLGEVTLERVAMIHARDMRALVYTVNRSDDIAHCHRCQVDGVFSDYPERVVEFNKRVQDNMEQSG